MNFTACKDGDVSFHDGNPLVFWKGGFFAICGDAFWDNQHGASVFCKTLGYESGTIEKAAGRSTSTSKAFRVGWCLSTDVNLSNCSGGRNKHTTHPFKECTNDYTYKIVCRGGDGAKASCKPGFLYKCFELCTSINFVLIF